jgi:TP901 family phage tail tape measure protein
MANEEVVITFKSNASTLSAPLRKASDEFARLGTSIDRTAQATKVLNQSFSQATDIKKLADNLGLTTTQASNAAKQIAALQAAGVSSDKAFAQLNQSLGLNKNQFDQISQAVSKYNQGLTAAQATIQRVNQATIAFAQSTGKSFGSAQSLANSLGLTSEKAAAAAQQIQQLNSVNATTQQKFTALNQSLGLTRAQFDALDKSIQKAADASRGFNNSAQSVSAFAKSIGSSFGGAQNFANSLGLTAGKANEAVTRLKELNSVGATSQQKFAALNSELGITKNQFTQLDNAARNTTQGLTALAAGAAAVAGAISAAFIKGTQDFVAFDSAIRQSGVIGGSSGTPQLEALREEVERLGLATTKTPAAIAQMSVELSRAGFTAEETSAALEGIVRASEATGENLTTVGDIIAKTIRSSGIANEETGKLVNLTAADSQRVADLLVQTANATNSSVTGLGESLTYVGSVAKASNQSIDDTLVLLGLLGDAGIQGSTAGTNLAAALERLKIASAGGETEFSNLVRGSKRATEAFEAIGAEVRNADGSMKSVLEILPVVQQNLSNLSQADKDVLMKALFGVEGGRAFQTLLNVTPERLALVTDQIKNSEGAAQAAGEEMTKGLGGALNLLSGSLTTASSKFGEFVAIGLEPLVRGAVELVNGFVKLPAPIQAALIATTAFTGVLAAAVAVLTAYTLAKNSAIIADTLAAGAVAAETIAKGLNTVATLANTDATVAATAIKGAFIAATKAATTANITFAGSAALVQRTILPLAVALGLVAGAYAAIETRQLANANQELETFQSTEQQLGQQSIALATRIKAAAEAKNQAQEKGIQQTEEEIEANKRLIAAGQSQVQALQSQIDAIKALPAGNEETKRSQDALVQSYQTQIDAINRQTEALAGQVDASQAATSANEDQAQSLEDLRAAAGETLDNQNADQERALSRQLQDEKAARDEALAERLGALQEQQQQTLGDLQESQQATLQAQQSAFDDAQAAKQEANQLRLQATEEAFTNKQDAAAAEFQAKETQITDAQKAVLDERQRAVDRELELAKIRDTQAQADNARLSEEERKLNQQIELATAQNLGQDTADLQAQQEQQDREAEARSQAEAQFAEQRRALDEERFRVQAEQEQRLAALREQLEAPIKAQQLADEQAAQARAAAFEKQQQGERTAFEQTVLNPLRKQLESELEAQKLAFEQTVLKPLREQQERELTDLRKSQEHELADIRKANDRAEEALSRQYEDEKIARDRAFKNEQRALDLANAEQIAQILTEAGLSIPTPTAQPTPVAGSRRAGGTVEPGQLYQVHADEFFIPQQRGTVLNQRDSRALVQQSLGLASAPVAAVSGGSDPALLREIRAMRGELAAIRQSGRPNQNIVMPPDDLKAQSRVHEFARAAARYSR